MRAVTLLCLFCLFAAACYVAVAQDGAAPYYARTCGLVATYALPLLLSAVILKWGGPERSERLIVLLCVLFAACHAGFTLGWATFPYANEYREWAQAEAALHFCAAGGPYAGPEGGGIYLYGFLYPLLGHAVHALFGGDVLLELRLLTYAFTLSTAALAARLVYEESRRTWAVALAFVLLLSVGWQNVPGVASPASLGTFLLLLALRLSRRGPVAPAVLTVLLFYVKPYFVALYLPLQVYFALRGRREGITYFAAFALTGVLSVVAVRAVWPYYYIYNMVHHATAASASMPHLLRQLAWSALYFLPLLWLFGRTLKQHIREAYALAAVCLFVVWLRLGMHTGAFMTYVFHLWLPPLVVASLARVGEVRRQNFFAAGVLLLAVVAAHKHLLPDPPGAEERAAWETVARQMERCEPGRTVCLSPMMASVASACGQRVADNGQAQYVCSLYNPSPLLRLLFPEEEAMQTRAETFEPRLLDELEHGPYKCVVADGGSLFDAMQLRMAGYHPYGSWNLRAGRYDSMVTIWKR